MFVNILIGHKVAKSFGLKNKSGQLEFFLLIMLVQPVIQLIINPKTHLFHFNFDVNINNF